MFDEIAPGGPPSSTVDQPPGRGEAIGQGIAWLARWSLRVVLVVLGVGLLGWILGQLWSIVFPVVLGLVLATVLQPPTTWLRRHRLPAALAALVTTAGGLALLTGLGLALAPTVAAQAPQIGQALATAIAQLQQWLTGFLGPGQLTQLIQTATDRLQQSASNIATGVLTGLSTIANWAVTAALALVLAFLFIKDGDRFLPWLGRQLGPTAGTHLVAVSRRAWNQLGEFIRSQAVVGLVDAVFIGLGLVLLGVPLALPLAVLTFFGAFLPIIGAVVAGALAVLIALVVNGVTNALLVLALVFLVQQLEGNVIQPLVQGRGLGLHAGVVILAVTAGSSLAGIVGAFLAVPLTAVTAEILRYTREQTAAHTGDGESQPTDTAEPPDPTNRPSTEPS